MSRSPWPSRGRSGLPSDRHPRPPRAAWPSGTAPTSHIFSAARGCPSRALVTAAPAGPSAGLPLRVAALAAWLSTAGAGAYLLAGWLAASGARYRRIPRGLVPITVLSHFALAVAGLGVWIAFMVAGSPVLGWLAVGLMILIAGWHGRAVHRPVPAEPGRRACPAGDASGRHRCPRRARDRDNPAGTAGRDRRRLTGRS